MCRWRESPSTLKLAVARLRSGHRLVKFSTENFILRRSIPDRETSSCFAPLCRGRESNPRRQPLQGCALPLSYRGIYFSILYFNPLLFANTFLISLFFMP